MKMISILLVCIVFFGCSETDKNLTIENKLIIEKDLSGFYFGDLQVSKNELGHFLQNICSIKSIEIFDLYPVLDSIANDESERSILVDSLKADGFNEINWGRGNWEKGPRIIIYTLTNDVCECVVDKLYYSTPINNRFIVTERVSCEKMK